MKILVIDDNPDNRFLLSKTLLRKFPTAALIECQSLETAVHILRQGGAELVIAHRTPEAEVADLVKELRTAHTTVPIIAVSGIDRRKAALAAGANVFHLFDEWLLIGNVAASLLDSAGNS